MHTQTYFKSLETKEKKEIEQVYNVSICSKVQIKENKERERTLIFLSSQWHGQKESQ